MGSDTIKFLRFVFETLLFIGFFHGVKPKVAPTNAKKAFALLILSFLSLLYFFDFLFPNIVLRFILRFLIFFMYLKFLKEISWQKAAYLSGMASSIYYALQNIFITPLLYPFFIESFIVVYGVFVFLFMFIYYQISFEKIEHIGADRVILLVSVISCILYVKYSLSVMIDGVSMKNIEMTLFPILLQLFLIASIILFEKYLYVQMEQEEARLHEVITNYKLQNIKNRIVAEDDLRLLTHDMKNHFIAIKKIVGTSEHHQLNSYINALLLNLESNDKYVETGNELLDGFLSEKIAEAEKDNISMSIILDYRPAAFISDMDICTIFGNALDNAIEASRKVANPNDRFISVYSSTTAGQLAISFANAYEGTINKVNGLPLTTKATSNHHGYGLLSLNKAVQKYDGIISINLDTDNKFILTVMFPIPITSTV